MRDTQQGEPELEDIPIVNEFLHVFSEDLPRVPPEQEIKFIIDLMLSTNPISNALYYMAPTELKVLKEQLQDLLDKGFIKPSVSPEDAPVLLVKKKDGTMQLYIDYCKLNK